MTSFSEDDLFNKGFMYGMRLANAGLMEPLDKKATRFELQKTIFRLIQAREGIDALIEEVVGLSEQASMRSILRKKGEIA